MPKFATERSIPAVGDLTSEDLPGVSEQSVDVLRDLGPDVQWVHIYVADDKTFCVHNASDETIIRERTRVAGSRTCTPT